MARLGALSNEERKKATYIFITLLAIYVIGRGLKAAAESPFWFDEFFTLGIATRPSLHEIWTALRSGIEPQTFLFYLLERLALALPIKREIALRLPSILAFPCILICVFVWVRRHSGELIACVCAVLLLSTSLFHTYMIDARPYTLAVASIALALVCYQRLPSPRWTVLFAASLMLAESFHYYAVFAMIPFWFAEATIFSGTRQFRWPVWLSLFLGLLPVVPGVPVLLRTRALYGPHFFGRAIFSQIFQYYGEFFVTDRASGIALLVVSATAIVWSMIAATTKGVEDRVDRHLPMSQGALLLGFNLLPFITFIVAWFGHGALLDRYVLPTTLGIVLSISCALSVTRSNAAVAFLAVFVLSIVGLHEKQFWQLSGHDPLDDSNYSARATAEFDEIKTLVQSSEHSDLPVVFDNGPIYFQMTYYSPPDWTKRLVYLTDEEKELSYHGTDTTVRVFKLFHNYFPLRLADYTEFTTTHLEFLVYSAPEGWMLDAMRREGASIQTLKNNGIHTVYLVKMRAASPQ